jgi:predicted ATPase/DNA-binding winged helix-turn-helix (wHTH) protein
LSEQVLVSETQRGGGRAEVDRRSDAVYTFGDFCLLPGRRKLLLAGQPIHIGSRAFAILVALVERVGTVVSAGELTALVWPGIIVDEANLRVQLGSLRKTLARGQGGRHAIETVPLRGYCFVLPVMQSFSSVPAPGSEVEHNLPSLLTPTIGRADTIELLTRSLASHRLVTVVGPGGIGKTTVAVAVAWRSLTLFADGARFVDFSSLSEPGLAASTLASTLGISVLSQDPLVGLIARLRGKLMLIVFDTCEHIVDAAAVLAQTLLAELPDIRILATSREALRAKGEWVHRLPSLPLPPVADGLTAVEALAFPSIELFVQQATANLDQFELTDDDAPVVAGICRRLDGIPLAIELAAARVDELGVREIATRLQDRFSVLTRGRRTALPRHQTLSATLNWSYDLLQPDEQAMLRRLAVFRGPFSADAVIAVAGETGGCRQALDTLSNLFVKSLLTADIDGEIVLYRLLDTTRAFAVEKLMEAGELATISRRHATYLCAALHDAETCWEAEDAALWISKFGHLIDDVRGALDWAMSAAGDRELAGRITALSAILWFGLSLLEEYGRRIEAALEPATARCYADPAIEIALLDALGHTAWHTRGDMPAMKACFTKALAGATREGLADAEYRALYGLIVYFATNGDYEEAVATSQRLGALAVSIDVPRAVANHRRLAAVASTFMGDHASVRDHAQYVLSHPGNNSGKTRLCGMFFDQRISVRTMLARTLWQQGFPDQARDCAEEGLKLARSMGHALSLCFVLAHAVVPIALWRGERSAAAEMTRLLLTSSKEHSFLIWHEFGRAYSTVLQPDSKCVSASSAPPEMGVLLLETVATLNEAAADDEILARGERGSAGWCTPELLRISGKLLLRPGKEDRARAEALLLRSLDVARQQGALSWELRSATSLAELWERENRREAAFSLLASVRDRFTEGFATADFVRSSLLLERLQGSP